MMLGHNIGQKLVDTLGLPKNTIGFTLRVFAGQFVTVECEYVLDDGSFAPALAEYYLAPRKMPEAEEGKLHYDVWLRRRTESAHREFMTRTSQLPP